MDQQDNPLLDASFDGNVKPRDIINEMQESYLDYAMSVIISRALPDVRDGLKPVQRRILYTMHTMGLTGGSKYKKSARIVGDVMGKYHPHGDSAIYTAMVRLAQDFSMRNMLVDGQGNFGSVDGDNAAAARYTEARLTRYAEAMLEDIEKETVAFRPNYDGSEQEPVVLPGKFPNLLVNGNMGIAVGMATNIPPHNLCEVIDAITLVLKNPDTSIDEIMTIIQGPDFPTAGVIYDSEHIKQVYATGRGSIIMRAKAVIEEGKSGKPRIIVTEIPYQVNKAAMIERMAMLVRDKKIVGITDIRDESNKEGIRVVIELRRDVQPKKILNQLYKMTQMQTNFAVNIIALADGVQPQLMNIKTVLEHYIGHRKIVIYKRTQFELAKAEDRLHILEGLKIAIDNIDEVIKTIRAAQTQEQAKTDLIAKFALSERQAEAILSMQLRRLAALERKKIEDEVKELEALVQKLKAILADPQLIIDIIENEIQELKEKYGDARRTEVVPSKLGEFKITDTIPNDDVVVALTRENYIKRMPVGTFKAQRRGGKGVVGMTTKEEDEIISLLTTKNHNQLLFFTNTGRVFKLHVYEIDEASRQAKGMAIVNLLNLQPGEKVVSVLDATAEKEAQYLFMTTKLGTVKKTPVSDFTNITSRGIIAIKIHENDELLWVHATSGVDKILLVSSKGQSIQFEEQDVRSMGRASSGVRGMRLKANDIVVEVAVVPEGSKMVLLVTEGGMGKMSSIEEYRIQNRGGSGIKAMNVTPKTGPVMGSRILTDQSADLLLVSKYGQMLRTSLSSISVKGRVTQGVCVMKFKEKDDKVASISIVEKSDEIESDVHEDQETLVEVDTL